MLIFYQNDNRSLYEIGKWNSYGNFIIEYLLKEEKNRQESIKFFCNKYRIKDLVNNFLKKEDKNLIKYKEQLIGFFLKINNLDQKGNENQNIINNPNINININIINIVNEYSLRKENENFLINIIILIESLNAFEKEIKNNLKASINQNLKGNSKYYLIKNNFIFQLKTLCEYNQIMKYFNEANNNNNKYLEEILNNENIINSILSNKKSINSLFNIENYKIKKINIDENFYLNDYYILDFNLFIKLGKINNDIYLIQNNEINLGFNSGKIIFNIKNFQNNNNENNNCRYYCLFIYL